MTRKIIILPESISNRIAAGEIIERPASVARELLDNAIDAESTRIELDLENGGKNLIRVTDNGCGFIPDGLLLAFERHATSKIRDINDLDAINTLGFRGEALPSIASVSRVTVESFSQDAASGARLRINGGKVESMETIACAPGTRFTVRNLFYNTPARKKFLKTTKTEYSHIYETVVDHAVSHTSIHFILRDSGREIINSPAVDVWSARLSALFGKKYVQEMIPVRNVHPDIRIDGVICHPDFLRSTGRAQRLYVNGRRIRDRIVTQAIYRGYGQFITGHGHPAYVIRIQMPPELVDVNVHPAKSEVRFRDSGTIFNLVTTLVNQSLSGSIKQRYDLQPSALSSSLHRSGSRQTAESAQSSSFQTGTPAQQWSGKPVVTGSNEMQRTSQEQYHPGTLQEAVSDPTPVSAGFNPEIPVVSGDSWKVVGQVFNTFILLESADKMLVIDQHTAHERLLFEIFRKRYESGNIPSQSLLFPAPVELEPAQFNALVDQGDMLQKMGLFLESFGKNTCLVTALPEHLHQEPPELLLQNLADELLEIGSTERPRIAERKMLVSLSCRRAIKAGDPMKPEEIEILIRDMMKHEVPNSCPHGRPIIVTFERQEIARRFKR